MRGAGRPHARTNSHVDMWTRTIFKTFHGTVEHGGVPPNLKDELGIGRGAVPENLGAPPNKEGLCAQGG